MGMIGNGEASLAGAPNAVVIVADTFRRDHLGAYGNPYIRTPNLDEFARSAAVFDRHVGSSFPTMPARADILPGTFSYTHTGWEPLPRHLITLPETLSKAGYTTMGVVDTPSFVRNGFGYDRGFDYFIRVRGQRDDTHPHERADARTMTEAENWQLYDLATDPGETPNAWEYNPEEGEALCEGAISFLEQQGTPEEHLAPAVGPSKRGEGPSGAEGPRAGFAVSSSR